MINLIVLTPKMVQKRFFPRKYTVSEDEGRGIMEITENCHAHPGGDHHLSPYHTMFRYTPAVADADRESRVDSVALEGAEEEAEQGPSSSWTALKREGEEGHGEQCIGGTG